MFKRIIDFHLDKWKTDPFRKPLILRGARQVGKTYADKFCQSKSKVDMGILYEVFIFF